MILRNLLLLFASVFCAANTVQADDAVDYLRHIKPILKERCYSCHGALKQKAGLRLDTVALMRLGGDNGTALLSGKANDSPLLHRIQSADPGKRMPPLSEGEPLTAKQIDMLRRWIAEGAKGPTSEKKEEDPRDHWAFRKPVRPELPPPLNPPLAKEGTPTNPIDSFIAAEHAKQGLTPQPRASEEHLLRRVYLDLIGLPPTREELHEYLRECASGQPHAAESAYEKVVDRLLASPHHGERWGRHWMDVWRYSDWYGRRHVPDVWNSAPQIWRWRDWIVKSLNTDKGYDRMVQEMLAADEIAPNDDEAAVATGFIVRNWYALNPHQWMRDTVEHTGKAFLGLTFNCCHCHDHKYDPISQEEYFRFRAFFEPIELRQDRVPGEGDPGPFQKYDYSKLRKIVKVGSVRVYDDKLDAKTFLYVGGDERNKVKDKPPVQPAGPGFLGGDKVAIEPMPLPVEVYYPALKPFVVQDETERRTRARAEAQTHLQKTRLAHASTAPESNAPLQSAQARFAAADAELEAYQARLAADRIRYKLQPGDEKTAGALASKAERHAALCVAQEKLLQAQQALAPAQTQAAAAAPKEKDAALKSVKLAEQQLDVAKKSLALAQKNAAAASDKYTPLGPSYPATSTGRRRALAQWIANRANPLTARVAVNHIWMRHFDRPLVETVFDFGRNGKRPSHPELLDWLAVEFMESGWSMKHLHRLIVTSNTYRMQSSAGSNPSAAKDPDNRYYWKANARRLEAEAVRDSLLSVAGELDRTVGGPVLENSEEQKSKRRSLYFAVFPEDGGHLKFLEIFDAPDACECYRRGDSVMPQQALALTNNQLAVTQSRLLARRLGDKLGKTTTDDAFIAAAFEQVLTRGPSAAELDACRGFLTKQRDVYRLADPKTLAASSEPVLRSRESLVRALFSHNDFVTVR